MSVSNVRGAFSRAHRTDGDYDDTLRRASDSIRVSRVLCITFMTYVHVHLFKYPVAESETYFMVTRSLLADLLGRSSVPLLSIISGALMVGICRKRTLPRLIRGRATTLLIPMVTWNFLYIALLAFTGNGGWNLSANALFALTESPANLPLAFLRDIFVVTLATPLLIAGAKRWPIAQLVVCTLLTQAVDFWPLLLRDQIFFYFVVGIYVGVYKVEDALGGIGFKRFIHFSMATLAVIAVLQPTSASLRELYQHSVFSNLALRPICAVWFWFAALSLSRWEPLRRIVRLHLEPAIFLLFLSHVISVRIFGSAFARVAPESPVVYYIVWLCIPLGCLGLAVLGKKVLNHLPSVVSLVFSGQSPGKKRPAAPFPAQTPPPPPGEPPPTPPMTSTATEREPH